MSTSNVGGTSDRDRVDFAASLKLTRQEVIALRERIAQWLEGEMELMTESLEIGEDLPEEVKKTIVYLIGIVRDPNCGIPPIDNLEK